MSRLTDTSFESAMEILDAFDLIEWQEEIYNKYNKLAEYENLGSVETIKSKLIEFNYLAKVHAMYGDNQQNFLNNQKLEHELEVYKSALKLVLTKVAEDNDMEFNEQEDIKFVLEEARKELEDEKV